MLALLAVRDDLRYLEGWFESVGPQVDGVVALDDGSTDGSAEFLESRDEVVELIRVPPERPSWDEMGNHRRLVEAAVRHGADWVVSLDADERVEREFRVRFERVAARGGRFGCRAYQVWLRELWGTPDQYRVDGIWGDRARARIFRPALDPVFDASPLHGSKVPLDSARYRHCPRADLEVYHLRMITPEGRRERRERYELADPEARWQPREGYGYLTDERGIELQAVDPARGYDGRREPGAAADQSPPVPIPQRSHSGPDGGTSSGPSASGSSGFVA
jgi:hypothetical protein